MEGVVPPKEWFVIARELITQAYINASYKDYLNYAKLKPVQLGGDYRYAESVLREMLAADAIRLSDQGRLMISDLGALPWFDEALLSGSSDAWALEEICEKHSGKGRKFDAKLLAQIGQTGEEYVLALLKESIPSELHVYVHHVSVSDDTVGYDIKSPSTSVDSAIRFIEVKTSSRPSVDKFSFFLSRNEFERGIRDPRWCIVAVQLLDGTCCTLGHIFAHQFESKMPKDVDSEARWQTARVDIESSTWLPGLP